MVAYSTGFCIVFELSTPVVNTQKASRGTEPAQNYKDDLMDEEQRTAQAEQRSEQLAARLRALGIDPDV
jgi:hypothetical protein